MSLGTLDIVPSAPLEVKLYNDFFIISEGVSGGSGGHFPQGEGGLTSGMKKRFETS